LNRPSTPLAVAAALPGGDPLAAALAAGETPSPELVAASGGTEGFKLRYAVLCLSFVLVGLAALPFVKQSMSLLAVTSAEYPPEVLEQKAREMAVAAGYSGKPADWMTWMWTDTEMSNWIQEKRAGKRDWRDWLTNYSPIFFQYRQSPRYLLSPPDGVIDHHRPPLEVPGMVLVLLDSGGRLRSFSGVAPREERMLDTAAPPFDPAPVFRMAGLDPAQFKEVEPAYAPPLAFDSRKAWSGDYPGLPNVPVTLEMASWRGKLTSLYIRWPWTKPVTPVEEPRSLKDRVTEVFSVLLLLTCLFCAIFFARRNIKLGRGDRKGAFRLAAAVFLLYSIGWATLHLVPDLHVLGYAAEQASEGLMSACLIWVLYLALEPAVRARWPHSLVTWNRLLAGQLRDPKLGSHILLGVVIGMAMEYAFVWRLHWLMVRGGPPDDINMEIVMGTRPFIAYLSQNLFNATQSGLVIFFALCGLRFLVRRDWAAAIVAALILGLREGLGRSSQSLALDAALIVLVYAVLAFVLLRLGLVPAMLGIFVINMSGSIPIASSFGSWMNPVAVTVLLLIAAIALYGFWRSESAASRRPGWVSVSGPV